MHQTWADLYVFLARLVAIYFAALVLVRLMGKRALGQLSLFDLVVMAGIGDVIVVVGLEQRVPVLDGLVVLGILGGMEILLSALTFRCRWFARLVEGYPTILVRNGKPIRDNMHREHFSAEDLNQELRKEGLDNPGQVKEAVLESCGKLSVIPRDDTEKRLGEILAELAALRREVNSLAGKIEDKP